MSRSQEPKTQVESSLPPLAETGRLALFAPHMGFLFRSGCIEETFPDAGLIRHPVRLLRELFSAAELRSRIRTVPDRPAEDTCGD